MRGADAGRIRLVELTGVILCVRVDNLSLLGMDAETNRRVHVGELRGQSKSELFNELAVGRSPSSPRVTRLYPTSLLQLLYS